jgi:hypothetical protein
MTRMEVRIAELRLRIESTGGATQLKPEWSGCGTPGIAPLGRKDVSGYNLVIG